LSYLNTARGALRRAQLLDCIVLFSVLSGGATWLSVPAYAQESCSVQDGLYTCTVPAGSYHSTISIVEPSSNVSSGQGLSVTNYGNATIEASPNQNAALSAFVDAEPAWSLDPPPGNADL